MVLFFGLQWVGAQCSDSVDTPLSACHFMGKPYHEGTPSGPSNAGPTTLCITGSEIQESQTVRTWVTFNRGVGTRCSTAIMGIKVPDMTITDPDFLNAAFVFYDENAQLVRVTIKDCLDNLKIGYDYKTIDLPWLDYRPPA
ncbi:hypothetical protein ACS0TY_018368 [Phlomoides rotata]